jgi:glyceraldehyde-3-phosphate dehydrogenase (NAD(P)+) (phosphorylating)
MRLPRSSVKVGVNGYGVIGKRVAEAISKQDDMKLVGVSKITGDYQAKLAEKKGFTIYCSVPERLSDMEASGVDPAGSILDLVKEVDIMVDCTPRGFGAKNRPMYEKARVKQVYQGGEKHEVASSSFVAQCNYAENLTKSATRVVSCNTTAICRVIGSLHTAFGAVKAWVVIFRRGADPAKSQSNGLINTVVPEENIPSHQGLDAQTVIPGLNITTLVAKGPFTLGHLCFGIVQTKNSVEKGDVLKVLRKTPRLVPVRRSEGVESMNAVTEVVRDLGRPRGDMWEVAFWEDIIHASGNEVNMVYQVHNESVVVPENVDAVRALTGLEENWERSVAKTDKSLGILNKFT